MALEKDHEKSIVKPYIVSSHLSFAQIALHLSRNKKEGSLETPSH